MWIPKHGWAQAGWYSLQWVVAMWAALLKGIILSCSYGYTSLVNRRSALGLSKIFFIEGRSEATPTMNTSLLCTEWEDGRHRCPSRCRCICILSPSKTKTLHTVVISRIWLWTKCWTTTIFMPLGSKHTRCVYYAVSVSVWMFSYITLQQYFVMREKKEVYSETKSHSNMNLKQKSSLHPQHWLWHVQVWRILSCVSLCLWSL